MKREPTAPISSRKAQIDAKLFETLYSDHYDPGVRRIVKAWLHTLAKAQKVL